MKAVEKKGRKAALVWLLIALALLSTCRAPAAQEEGPAALLAGEWEGSEGLMEFQAMEFVPQEDDAQRGSVQLSLLSGLIGGSYTVVPAALSGEPDRLCITYTLASLSVRRNYRFTVDAQALTLTNENTAAQMDYQRKAG